MSSDEHSQLLQAKDAEIARLRREIHELKRLEKNMDPGHGNVKKRNAPESPILQLDSIQIPFDIAKSEERVGGPSRKRQRKNNADVPEVQLDVERASPSLDALDLADGAAEYSSGRDEPMTAAEAPAALRRLGNPKAEIKQEAFLNDEAVIRRLAPASLHPFPITLAPEIRDKTVSRPALSKHFGGNARSSFPTIPAGKLAEHGYDNFMCINLLYAPHAPRNSGHPGLFFQTTPAVGQWSQHRPSCNWQTMVVFVRLKAGAWLYLGSYEMTAVESLTPEHWRAQSEAVRRNWSDNIATKDWAKDIRVSIHLRRRLSRDPTQEEIDVGGKDGRKYEDVTAEDVMKAYDSGEETMGVWCMKCVGYDEDFQRLVSSLERRKKSSKNSKRATGGTRS